MDWGRRGAELAAARGDILVIIDVIRFSTTIAQAVQCGGEIYPCPETEDVEAVAATFGAIAAVKKPMPGQFSLSPKSVARLAPRTRIVLSSLNGATCSHLAAHVPLLFIGAPVNAQAVGAAVEKALGEYPDRSVTVVACGERWNGPHEDGALRFAIEDYLGAGVILSYLSFSKSPEARLCEAAFHAASGDLEALLLDCGSGRELAGRDQIDDVRFAARINCLSAVPVMRSDGWIVAQSGGSIPGSA